jgi:arylsulfatase A-like enzyme
MERGFTKVLAPYRKEWQDSTIGALVDHFSPALQWISEPLRWQMPYVDADQLVNIVKRAVPNADVPVFLFVNLLDAHSPYNPPASALKQLSLKPKHLFGRYRSHRELTAMWKSLPNGSRDQLIDLYDGELRWLDTHVGTLLDWIDERLGPDTAVIVTADHGEELGEAGRVGHEFGLSQALLHVPLFVRAASLPPTVIDEPVSLRGLNDFILSIATGSEVTVDDLTRTDDFGLIAERYGSGANARTYGADYELPWVALFQGGYKAVGRPGGAFEFFDLHNSDFDAPPKAEDISEATRLSGRVSNYWETHRDRREDSSTFDTLSDDMLDQLRSLGYIR